ncbi:hypothetical protein [Acetobacter nitrogenifigens]|uniref:Uncharacterized protein n=1 Tax=Acetobacter nitrogenifigens DSM 23921 = NBRC 105050 TaxID=1120919 RepID=A0A511XDF3_9PROT|nr:hypothetical protein [Acetobacter nitrogenifigens]GEN60987.1 hypothetical protein ANI02nite_28710 [Acetobacter nitrogenifigens DSM 23921 = NBRC 105050]
MDTATTALADARTLSDVTFLKDWRHASARDTAQLLRASLLRRTNPELVRRVTQETAPNLPAKHHGSCG